MIRESLLNHLLTSMQNPPIPALIDNIHHITLNGTVEGVIVLDGDDVKLNAFCLDGERKGFADIDDALRYLDAKLTDQRTVIDTAWKMEKESYYNACIIADATGYANPIAAMQSGALELVTLIKDNQGNITEVTSFSKHQRIN